MSNCVPGGSIGHPDDTNKVQESGTIKHGPIVARKESMGIEVPKSAVLSKKIENRRVEVGHNSAAGVAQAPNAKISPFHNRKAKVISKDSHKARKYERTGLNLYFGKNAPDLKLRKIRRLTPEEISSKNLIRRNGSYK